MGKTLAETDTSDMPRYLVQSDFEPFPFQSGRIMARFQSVGITQYFQMSVKRGSSQLMTGAPPDLSSSAVIPQIPGSRFFFSFRIAADISSAIGGVESTEGSGSTGSFGHEDRIEWWSRVVELFLEVAFPSVELVRFIAEWRSILGSHRRRQPIQRVAS